MHLLYQRCFGFFFCTVSIGSTIRRTPHRGHGHHPRRCPYTDQDDDVKIKKILPSHHLSFNYNNDDDNQHYSGIHCVHEDDSYSMQQQQTQPPPKQYYYGSSGGAIPRKTFLDFRNRWRELLLSNGTAQLLSFLLVSSLSDIIKQPLSAQAVVSDDLQRKVTLPRGVVFEIEDPSTYSAVVYVPHHATEKNRQHHGGDKKSAQQPILIEYPLLVVLHGAGNNEHSAMYEFTSNSGGSSSTPLFLRGDHIYLPPYFLSREQAPVVLSDNFVVVAPYVGKDKTLRSLYDEPRTKILSFVKWFTNWIETQSFRDDNDSEEDGSSSMIRINRQRISLFGFSEGSNLAVELATTRQFNGIILASYGFTGTLPPLALERLYGIPLWIFHSVKDDVYDIRYSNQLVDSLVMYHKGNDIFDVQKTVKYTKLLPEKNDLNAIGMEHVRAAIVASKSKEVYDWLLSL